MRFIGVVAFALVSLLARPAAADLVTYRNGENVSNAIGAHFTEITFAQLPVGVPNQLIRTDLTTLTGRYGDLVERWCLEAAISTTFGCRGSLNRFLEVSFEHPTDFISITGFHFADSPGLLVYDTEGRLMSYCIGGYPSGSTGPGSYTGTVGGGNGTQCGLNISWQMYGSFETTLTLSSSSGNIGRIVWGQVAANNAEIREISYNTTVGVPEPGTLGLVVLGMVTAFSSRRRRTSRRAHAERPKILLA